MIPALERFSIGILSVCVKLFQIAGFFTFAIGFDARSGMTIGDHCWNVKVWWLAQLGCSLASAVMGHFRYHHLYAGLQATEAMNNCFKYAIGLVTVFVTLADSWRSCEAHRSIWTHYRCLAIDRDAYLGLLSQQAVVRVARCYGAMFLVVVATCVMVEYQVYYGVAAGTQWYWYWLYNLYPSTINRMCHMFHLFHICLMERNLRELEREIKALGGRIGEAVLDTGAHAMCLGELRSVYTELSGVNENINELFGWPQAFNISASFVQMAFDLYWAYMMGERNEENLDVQLFCFVPAPVILGFLLYMANRYQLAVDSIGRTLLELPCLPASAGYEPLKCYFLKQLQQTHMRLTAKNIFDFDFTLIRKFAVGIATYVVIFIEITR
ncbi:putative gustatory receptor 39b [Anopheles cruzii]|uniref:putative gustatory receptor 39b n=1 Tax=Anopheles cruzii TaxID=68878 RepID=UPI0022EC6503|nr:putative gustatory receptor 39b [Anopheles cruzii]